MKTIELPANSADMEGMLKLAAEENLILKTSDGREFILAEVDDFDREITLTRQNVELMKFLDERSQEKKTFSLNEIKQQFNLF